jgi:hypothetical protein
MQASWAAEWQTKSASPRRHCLTARVQQGFRGVLLCLAAANGTGFASSPGPSAQRPSPRKTPAASSWFSFGSSSGILSPMTTRTLPGVCSGAERKGLGSTRSHADPLSRRPGWGRPGLPTRGPFGRLSLQALPERQAATMPMRPDATGQGPTVEAARRGRRRAAPRALGPRSLPSPARTGPRFGVGWRGPAPRPLAQKVLTVSNHSEFRWESALRLMDEGLRLARARLKSGCPFQSEVRRMSVFRGKATGFATIARQLRTQS